MTEPDWGNFKLSIERSNDSTRILRDDLVWVVKSSRGKFGLMQKAVKGDHGIVISSWVSSYGTDKITILTSDMREVATTVSCAKIFGSISGQSDMWEEWRMLKLRWIEATYIPVIINRIIKAPRRQRISREPVNSLAKYVESKDGTSMLVTPLSSGNEIWISKDKTHPSDWEDVLRSTKLCHSIRIPKWLYEKGGF